MKLSARALRPHRFAHMTLRALLLLWVLTPVVVFCIYLIATNNDAAEQRSVSWMLWVPLLLLYVALGQSWFRAFSRLRRWQRREGTPAAVVLLRPFAKDTEAVSNRVWSSASVIPRLLIRVFGPAGFLGAFVFRPRSMEALLAPELWKRFGRFVAIGWPGEWFPREGADRVYTSDAEWKDVVMGLIAEAKVVVVLAGDTPGIIWELTYLAAHVSPEKIVLLTEPQEAARSLWDAAREIFDDAGFTIPERDPGPGSVIAFDRELIGHTVARALVTPAGFGSAIVRAIAGEIPAEPVAIPLSAIAQRSIDYAVFKKRLTNEIAFGGAPGCLIKLVTIPVTLVAALSLTALPGLMGLPAIDWSHSGNQDAAVTLAAIPGVLVGYLFFSGLARLLFAWKTRPPKKRRRPR